MSNCAFAGIKTEDAAIFRSGTFHRRPASASSRVLSLSYVRNNHLPRFFPPSPPTLLLLFPRQIKSAGLISTLRRSHELRMGVGWVAIATDGRGDRWTEGERGERAPAVWPPVRLWASVRVRNPKDGERPSARQSMPSLGSSAQGGIFEVFFRSIPLFFKL